MNWQKKSREQKLTASAQILLVSYFISLFALFAILLGSCNSVPKSFPKGPGCILGDAGCICFDPTLPEGKQRYEIAYGAEGCLNNVATTPLQYAKIREWVGRHCSDKPMNLEE